MNAIFKRRSVRKFIDKDIRDIDITLLLQAAMRALSADNEQPWEFIVIKDSKILKGIPLSHPYTATLHHTKCAIVICENIKLQKFPYDFWCKIVEQLPRIY